MNTGEAYWLPFTPNRYFRAHPKLLVSAKGAYFRTEDGRELFDTLSGLWCTPLGHARPQIAEALKRQAETLDYATAFQVSNPVTLRLADRVAAMAPAPLKRVFFCNSGSESVDSALKIALAYHRSRNEGHRMRFIGRERAYHGVGFGGISLGGMVANRKVFAPLMLPGVDHLSHPWNPREMAFSKGQPTWGAHLAEELARLAALHDASTIAAVMVEPVQGSTGVLVPPVGYLQRLRELCTQLGILLIFDEVITGFGRLGANFAAQRFGVIPDMITFAKAVTNGIVPLGGVLVREDIYQSIVGTTAAEHVPELFHGYTYSGHPVAAAAGHAALDIMQEENLIERARQLEPVLENVMHALKTEPGVIDIRNCGLSAALDMEPIGGKPGLRAFKVFEHGFAHRHLFRVTGDTISVGPPFIATPEELADLAEGLRAGLRAAFA